MNGIPISPILMNKVCGNPDVTWVMNTCHMPEFLGRMYEDGFKVLVSPLTDSAVAIGARLGDAETDGDGLGETEVLGDDEALGEEVG